MSEWLEANAESKHAAVYAVVGKDGTFNFVGVSRNVALSLAGHVKEQGQDKVYQVKVRPSERDAMDEIHILNSNSAPRTSASEVPSVVICGRPFFRCGVINIRNATSWVLCRRNGLRSADTSLRATYVEGSGLLA